LDETRAQDFGRSVFQNAKSVQQLQSGNPVSKNPKFEALNPKQIQRTKIVNSKQIYNRLFYIIGFI
jgi:hypothetical protein